MEDNNEKNLALGNEESMAESRQDNSTPISNPAAPEKSENNAL